MSASYILKLLKIEQVIQGRKVNFLNFCQDESRWVLDLGWDNWRTFSSYMWSQMSASYILKLIKNEEVIQSWKMIEKVKKVKGKS